MKYAIVIISLLQRMRQEKSSPSMNLSIFKRRAQLLSIYADKKASPKEALSKEKVAGGCTYTREAH